MDKKETKRFDKLYQRHLQMLNLQGKSEKTREAYARSVRRLRDHFDCCPDKLTPKQLESYFAQLVETHSWSTVKLDCYGFKFFWKFVLEKDMQWINIVHPKLLFPNVSGPIDRIKYAKNHMDMGGTQKAMKVVVQECGIKKSLHPFASPQLCHPSSGTWPEPASYPAPFGPCQLEHHRTIHPTHRDFRKR